MFISCFIGFLVWGKKICVSFISYIKKKKKKRAMLLLLSRFSRDRFCATP